MICWSSGFVGIRFATDSATVPQILFGRSIFSGLTLLPLALLRGPRIDFTRRCRTGAPYAFGYGNVPVTLSGFAVAIGIGACRPALSATDSLADLVPLGIAVLSAADPKARRCWGCNVCAEVAQIIMQSFRSRQTPRRWSCEACFSARYALPILGMLAFALSTVLQERRAAVPLDHPAAPLPATACGRQTCSGRPVAVWSGGCSRYPLTASYALGMIGLVVLADLWRLG